MPLNEIEATTPTTTEPIKAVTYDLWVPVQLNYQSAPKGRNRLAAQFQKARKLEDGSLERGNDSTRVAVNDIDDKLEGLLNALVAELVSRGQAEGKL